MRLSLFPDVNVWVALTYEGHIHHRRARRWFESLPPDSSLYFCRITQLGLLRLLTTEAVMGAAEVLSQAGAWTAYDRWLEDDRVAFLAEPQSPAALDGEFRKISVVRKRAPKDWADSYLVAFASAFDLTLVTFDRALHDRARRALMPR
jgi:uncharacterized protein